MPYTTLEQDAIIRAHGFEPDAYELTPDEHGIAPRSSPRRVAVEQPSVTAGLGLEPAPRPPASNSEAFFSGVTQSAPAAVGSGLAGGLALKALSSAIPGVTPWTLAAKGALTLGAAYLGARAGEGVKQAIQSPESTENAARLQEENPLAFGAGSVATIPLAGFRPSYDALRAVGGLAKMYRGVSLMPRETSAMWNTGLNVGLQPLTDIAAAQVEGRPMPSLGELAGSAALGAVFSKPWALGRAYGFPSDIVPQNRGLPELDALLRLEELQKMQAEAAAQEQQAFAKGFTIGRGLGIVQNPASSGTLISKGQQLGVDAKGNPIYAKKEKYVPGYNPGDPSNPPAMNSALNMQRAWADQAQREFDAEAPLIQAEQERAQAERFQDESNTLTPLARQVLAGLQERGLTGVPTPRWTEGFQRFGRRVRGTDVRVVPELKGAEGDEVAGRALPRASADEPSIVELNPAKAGADTAPHEFGHEYIAQLRRFGKPADKAFVDAYDSAVAASDEFKAVNAALEAEGKPKWSVEEFQASEQGMEYLRRRMEDSNEWKTFWKDLGAHVRSHKGKGTLEDYRRALNYRIEFDPAYKKVFGDGMPSAAGVASKEQPNSALNPDWRKDQQEDIAELYPRVRVAAATEEASTTAPAPSTSVSPARAKELFTDANYNNGEGSYTVSRWPIKKDVIDQEPGMRLNYDTILPRIAEELTGSKGELVSLGEHKNAFDAKVENGQYYLKNPKTGEVKAFDYDLQYKEIQDLYKQGWVDTLKQRSSLIFTNPDGTPKTDVSGVMYPLEKTVSQPTVLGKGAPGSRYQDTSALMKQTETPEFKKWFGESKVVDAEGKPLVVYHGTESSPFTIFKEGFGQARGNALGSGMYFTTSKKSAELFGNNVVYEVFLKLERPLDLRKPENRKLMWEEKGIYPHIERMRKSGEIDGIIDISSRGAEYGLDFVVFHPEQIKSAIGNRGTFDPTNPDIREQFRSPLRPEIEKIREDFGADGAIVAGDNQKGFTGMLEEYSRITGELNETYPLGKFINKLNPKELWLNTSDDIETVGKYLLAESYGKTPAKALTPKQQEIYDTVRNQLLQSVALKNSFPSLRKTVPDPKYYPQVPRDEVLNILLNKPGSPEAARLKADFYALHGATADAKWKEFMNGYDKQKVNLADQFGPIDKSAGVGIPESWAESSPMKVMPRFNNRYARRIAWEKTIATQPDVMKALENIKAADTVKNVLDDIQGVTEHQEALRNALGGVVRAGMLGPLTGAKDFVTNLTLGFQHQTSDQTVRSLVDATQNLVDNWRRSFKTGVNRRAFGTLEFGDGGLDGVSSVLRRVRDTMNSVQGRNFLETVNRAVAFGQGRFLAIDNIQAAQKGALSAQQNRFLNDFAKAEWQKYKRSGMFTPEELDRIAARYAESVQGTYDARGLPHIATRGTFAPVLSLARWNIEKFNNFKKYVVEPAVKEGDFRPLLMQTVGMIIGGTAVTKLVEEVTGKTEKTPKWKEIAAAHEAGEQVIDDIAYKFAGLSSLAGYAGILSDVMRSSLDVLNKNMPQTYNNPLIEAMESGTRLAGEAAVAMSDGDFKLGANLISQFLEDFLQSYRIALAQLSPEQQEEIGRKNAMRDLKTFRTLHDLPTNMFTGSRANPFKEQELREFKRTDDLEKALDLLPKLIERAVEKYEDDPEQLEQELNKIKRNSYQTMPSPERMPMQFMAYYDFLQKTRGVEKANEAYMDYVTQNAMNRAKSAMVP